MKKISKLILLSSTLIMLFWSCKKDEVKDYLEFRTPPTLTASTNAVDLAFLNADKEALKLTWTNPNYQFTTGASSQNVSYLVEIDLAGNNFTNPQKQTIAVSKELSTSFKVLQFNDYLLNQLVLAPGIQAHLEMRVRSSLGTNGAATLFSNTIAVTATPYAIPPKVELPKNKELFIVGNATNGGWNNPVPVPSQQFTTIDPTLYEIIIPLIGGNSYTLLPVNGDWGTKYSIKTKNDPALVNGGDFQKGGEDILAPAASGNYKITVDFQRGKFTVAKQ